MSRAPTSDLFVGLAMFGLCVPSWALDATLKKSSPRPSQPGAPGGPTRGSPALHNCASGGERQRLGFARLLFLGGEFSWIGGDRCGWGPERVGHE